MHKVVSLTNVALRALLETSIVVTFAFWGYAVADDTAIRILLAVLAPVVVFGFWGAVDFRFAGRHAEALRLSQELAVTALAGAAVYTTGHHLLAWLLLLLSLVHHTAVYLLGERLLKPQTTQPDPHRDERARPEAGRPPARRQSGRDNAPPQRT